MNDRRIDLAALILRLTLGTMFVAHGLLKVFVFTPAGTAQFFASLGLPAGLAYLVIAAETLGGVALILGIYGRVVALALVPILLGAIFTVHGPAGFFFTNPNGGWEYLALWVVALVSVGLLGDGAFAMKPSPAAHPAIA